MTFQALQVMNPQINPSSTSEVIEDYVSTGTDAAEYKLWQQFNNTADEGLDDHSDDLANAGWLPTGD